MGLWRKFREKMNSVKNAKIKMKIKLNKAIH